MITAITLMKIRIATMMVMVPMIVVMTRMNLEF